jgi:hypothetical protein
MISAHRFPNSADWSSNGWRSCGKLAESMELSSLALARNDAEAIARGAAHQAELCRQWSCLEVNFAVKLAGVLSPGRMKHASGNSMGASTRRGCKPSGSA